MQHYTAQMAEKEDDGSVREKSFSQTDMVFYIRICGTYAETETGGMVKYYMHKTKRGR